MARQMHGSVIAGNRIYVINGNTPNGWSDEVLSAEILNDGNLGEWRQEGRTPDRRCYIAHGTIVVRDHIYVIGGTTTNVNNTVHDAMPTTNTISYTMIKADGTLGDWKVSEPFAPAGRSNVAASVSGDYIYMTGGKGRGTVESDVIRGRINDKGEPVEWTNIGALPTPLWFHGSTIIDNRLYVWGGLTTQGTNTPNSEVFVADINPDHTLSDWRKSTSMPKAVYSSAFFGFNDLLLSVGGRYVNGVPTNDIWYSTVKDKVVQPWIQLTTDLDTRIYHSFALDESRGNVFIIGGRFRANSNPSDIGHLVSEVAAFKLGVGGTQSATEGLTSHASLDAAVAAAAKSKKPVLAYFFSPNVPACERFVSNVLNANPVKALLANYEVVKVDAVNSADTATKYSIFRVPALLKLDAAGKQLEQTRAQTPADVVTFLK